ncbi:hypothetical protein AYO37_00505 [Opitutia bacterium SCGC AG-212-L18]|nr:hypothetical protein AYO37_00505 [Opitutae bacterium SCGC AG-212-L18]
MKLLKENKPLFITLFILFIIISTNLTAIFFHNSQLNKEKDYFLSMKTEFISILKNETEISEESKNASIENIKEIHKIKNEWQLNTPHASATPIECYLNLQNHIESLKIAAKLSNTTLAPECYHVFSKYQEAEQLQLIALFMHELIKAQPKEILLIHPDSPQLKIHDIFSSQAFKIAFIGNTQCLRSFVNDIKESMLILIRDIEINPLEPKDPTYSIFSLIVEALEINYPKPIS